MSDVSVVVRDLREHPPVLDFVPDNVEVIVSNWTADDFDMGDRASNVVESMAVARNDGAMRASGDILVFLDGDVAFSPAFFWLTVSQCKPGVVVGVRNPWQGHLQGAYLVIHRDDFFRAGGVDPHMFFNEDRAFGYKLRGMGLRLVLYPMDCISNLDDDETRYCRSFPLYLRMQLALLCMYPRQHWNMIPRSIYDYFYHIITEVIQ